jgi:acetyl esterase
MYLQWGVLLLASLSFPMFTAFGASSPAATRDVEYAKPNGVPLYLDAYVPEGPGPFAAAIIVHGGAWVRGDRRNEVAPLFRPLEDAGIAWFSIDYRLSSDVTQFGTAIEDVRNAVLFVKAHAAEYRIDPERIALIGESAGGQLAAMVALDPRTDTQVRAVVALYAPTDLVSLAKESTFVPQQIRKAIEGTPFEAILLERLRQLSPSANVRPGAPPFLLIHGTSDVLVPFAQSREMCAKLKANGSGCELYPVEGGGHGIRWWESSHPRESRSYKAEMVHWLGAQLTPDAGSGTAKGPAHPAEYSSAGK